MERAYPPSEHVLRDLALEIHRRGGGIELHAPVQPGLLTDRGAVSAGALAIALDVFGGNVAIEAVQPDWTATQELQLHLLRPVESGRLRVCGRALRAGRTSIVIEAEIHDDGPEEGPAASGAVTFTRLARRDGNPSYEPEGGDRYDFALPGSGLRGPLGPQLGLRESGDTLAGELELDLAPYVRNSFDALQGGVVAALAEASAQRAARALQGRPLVTTDLSVRYLASARVGPVAARARLLRHVDATALLRVELRDRGADDRLLSVVSAMVGELPPGPSGAP